MAGGGVMAVAFHRRPFTVGEYHTMLDAGILSEDDRVELIEGEIVQMSPIGSRHAGQVNRLNRMLVRALGERGVVTVQNPVTLSDLSEPEPDLAVLHPRPDDYAGAHPAPGDILLLVEVAGASLAFDRQVKLPLYARSGIPEVWLLPIEHAVLEVHRSPAGAAYRDVRQLRTGDSVSPLAFPDLQLEVARLLL
jgi:Uma2 family endonuclease